MENWDDYFLFLELWDDSRSAGGSFEPDKRKDSERLEAFARLKALLLVEDEETLAAKAQAKILRNLVEYPTWHLAARETDEKELAIYTFEPAEKETTIVDGPRLVRSIPEEIEKLLVYENIQDKSSARIIEAEHFAELHSLAESVELEDLLALPGKDQIERLLCSKFLVEASEEGEKLTLSPRSKHPDDRIAYVYTHKDKVSYRPVLPMTGRELFELVSTCAEVDGIIINSTSQVGRNERSINRLLLSSGFAKNALEGKDTRFGAERLIARSREEIELWLDLNDFPHKGREWIESLEAETAVLQIRAAGDTNWSMQEVDGRQVPGESREWTLSPVFCLAANNKEASAASKILCPGLLARRLGLRSGDVDSRRRKKPGQFLLFFRLVAEKERQHYRKRLIMAEELAAFLPKSGDRIPRTACITVKGARTLSRSPYAATRAWIEKTIAGAKRGTRKFLPPF
ncbi:MAG TPA: hypothetical protein PKD05_02170 [Candidatus Melainabacteria bacterium]|nr:hypothetical protein [Candidatus Melainabacteria bacterium]